MTVALTNNFLRIARGLTLKDGGGLAWSINANTNEIVAAGSAGAVLSSVGLADISAVPIYTITNSPLVANGTIDIALHTQTANLVFAGPVTGVAAQPAFRALVAADMPAFTGGDVTSSAGSVVLTIGASTVTLAKMANIADQRILGNNSGAAAAPIALTATQVKTVLAIAYTDVSGLATVAHTGAYSDLTGTPSIPTGANPTAKVGLAAVNGVSASFMRADGAPQLDQAIVPTWTGAHAWQSTMQANANPLAAATTTVATGIAAVQTGTQTRTSNTLTAETQLSLTFNETGWYEFELYFPVTEAAAGTGGFQFDLNAASNTATVGTLVYDVTGFGTAAIANTVAVTAVGTATSVANISTSTSAPSWIRAKGVMQITGAGKLTPRTAQASTDGTHATTIGAGAYFRAIKAA